MLKPGQNIERIQFKSVVVKNTNSHLTFLLWKGQLKVQLLCVFCLGVLGKRLVSLGDEPSKNGRVEGATMATSCVHPCCIMLNVGGVPQILVSIY